MKRSFCLLLTILFLVPLVSIASSSEPINIVLLGSDSLGYVNVTDTDEMSRADAIFVLSIQPKADLIKLLSIERDYLVTLPDGLGENKLSTATYFGGPDMAIKAINQLFDTHIGLYAQIDIANLITAVDLFGGIEVEVFPEELNGINAFISDIKPAGVPLLVEGKNHLNGLQAWAFLAERNHELDEISSNAERNNRQKRLFAATLDQAFVMNMTDLIKIVSETLPLIQTNISMNTLFKIIETTLKIKADQIVYQRSPQGDFSLKRINMHRVVVPDDIASEIAFVHLFLSDGEE